MTYKDEIANDLKEKWIFYKRRINKVFDKQEDYVFFKKWFYIRVELIDFLLQWNEIKTYAQYPWNFICLVWLWSTVALRYATFTSKKYIHLQHWFYNKKNLIKYLLLKFNW